MSHWFDTRAEPEPNKVWAAVKFVITIAVLCAAIYFGGVYFL